MLDCTQAAFRQIFEKLKKAQYIFHIVTLVTSMLYPIYALIVGLGFIWINICLIILTLTYLIFFLVTTNLGEKPDGKSLKKVKNGGKQIYKWSKRAIRVVTLSIAIYGLCQTATNVKALSLLLTVCNIVFFLLQIAIDVLVAILKPHVVLVKEAVEADIDQILKPITATKNFFKKITGQEVEPKKQLTENQVLLKQKAEEFKAEQQRKKEERKKAWRQTKIFKKIEAKQQATELKKSKKKEKSLLKAANKEEKKAKKQKKTNKDNTSLTTSPLLSSKEDKLTDISTEISISRNSKKNGNS